MTCPGGFLFGRHHFRCWKRHGSGIDVHKAIKQSCDFYFYETVNRVGIDRLAVTARELGLGQIHDIGFAGQKQGIIPDTAWKRATLGQPWYPGETISCGIGQGYVAATPLQLAVAAARIATGRAVSPRLMVPNDARGRARAAARHRSGESRARARRHGRRGERERRHRRALGADHSRRADGGKDRHLAGDQREEPRVPQRLGRRDPRPIHRLRAGRRAALRRGLRRRAWRRRIARGGAGGARRDDRDPVARSGSQAGLRRQQPGRRVFGRRRRGAAQ